MTARARYRRGGFAGRQSSGGDPSGAAFSAAAAAQDLRGPSAPASFADLADKVRPAVVSVNVKSRGAVGDVSNRDFPMPDLPQDPPLRDFFDQFKHGQPERRPTRAQGSGFLISADGYIVTNHHVADKADEIEITFENEEKYKAKIIGSDSRTDIALLKIDAKKKFASWLEFADSSAARWRLGAGRRQSVRSRRHGDGRHRLGLGPRYWLWPL